jgi:hypothetical protein
MKSGYVMLKGINCRLLYFSKPSGVGENYLPVAPQIKHDYTSVFSIANRKAAKSRNHSHGVMNVHHLVQHIRKADITPETVVIVWATNYKDLSTLRDWLG